jgi:hypothetical protein
VGALPAARATAEADQAYIKPRRAVMRRLLLVLLLLVGGVVAPGFCRGWFSFKTTNDPQAGREGAAFEIDRNRIQPDIGKVREKIGGGGTQEEEKPEGQHP